MRRCGCEDDLPSRRALGFDQRDTLGIESVRDQIPCEPVGQPRRFALGQRAAKRDPMHRLLHPATRDQLHRIE